MKRKLSALLLAALLALGTALCFAGCGDGNSSASAPSPSAPSSPSSPSTPSSPDGTTPDGKDDGPYSQYSDILKTILTTKNPYYGELMEKYKYGTSISITDRNEVQALPYGFYEEENIDVAGVKNNDLSAGAHLYIKNDEPNNLYVVTVVETKTAESDYYSTYILKYPLTDAELKDLKMLFQGDYIHANFFVQELSYAKKPTVVGKFKIDVDTYWGILETLKKEAYITSLIYPNSVCFINFNSIDINPDNSLEHILNLDFVSAPSSKKNIDTGINGNFTIIARFISGLSYDNDILKMNNPNRTVIKSKEEFENSLVEVTNFDIRDNRAKINLIENITG